MPELNWIGKNAVVNHHREVPYRLVHCDSDLSAGDADSGNLLVQGDNLEALKALLPYYAGKVKCIYIDPPYNTGNENWVYNDNVNSSEIKQWLGKVVGKEAEDLSRHDKWLCMMYPRLRLLREFLREDGAIFISIDDNENHHLRNLMDEVFGHNRFIANIMWQKRTSRENRSAIGDSHDFILVYAKKNIETWKAVRNLLPPNDKGFSNPDNDPRGPWRSIPFSAQGFRKEQMYEIVTPTAKTLLPPDGRCWGATRPKFDQFLADNRVYFPNGGNGRPRIKQFQGEEKGLVPNTVWLAEEVSDNERGKKEVIEILGGDEIFDTPKPTGLLNRILQISTDPGDLIMDSFAGSGTTGHAVLDLNKQNGGNRQFILVEMDERIAPEITGERLRRVINGYDKGGDASKPVEGLGGGFRYCRLGTPLFDEFGDIDGAVSFPDLAAHVFFSETGAPIPQRVDGSTPLVGQHGAQIVYLLYSEPEQGFAREEAGNVLTPDMLANLPAAPEGFEGERVVYAEGCTVSADRLKAEGIVFKQIPYSIQGQ